MRLVLRNYATVFSLTLLFASAAPGAKWEATVTSSSPPSFPGPRPMRAKYIFSWSGFPGANAEVRLTKPSGDRVQLDGSIHTIGLVRTLWKFDGTQNASANASRRRAICVQYTETRILGSLDRTQVYFAYVPGFASNFALQPKAQK